MMHSDFSDVTDWVFDLDNTLYPPSARLFDQIELRMVDFVMRTLSVDRAQANYLRGHYWQLYGTTLAGLMHEHGVDPVPFLDEVHEISLDHLEHDVALRAGISALPGRKIVYTNGSAPYAKRVLEARGLSGLFEDIYGVEHADFHPKPRAQAFDTVFAKAGITPARGAMFEDDPRNLSHPHALGMRTIHVAPEPVSEPFIQHHTDDLAGFLARLAQG
ncbi:HAD family hydrolase [Thioclava dalianensis]|uniref:HAD family hydrolase n=1 Tax=Thioclava dalianensis TaxID=1185766 RepID=A0A074U1U3_9RHOB|nr:pyrimidine 5'-nucleotidase [Thioclava dalianensis]KEP68647.1 HAD family hydrolase [Thioclava dalianensis]SFN04003.1 putative hydrolase of the HAD superfamily [Thioclava dalianensis]